MAIDGAGNYGIAGSTRSLDLPANTLQTRFGGAFLYRIGQGEIEPLHPSQTAAITAIAADPFHPGTLYASFSRAVWKSHDRGNTWQRLNAEWSPTADCVQIVAARDGATVYALSPEEFLTKAVFRFRQNRLFGRFGAHARRH